MYYEGWWEGEEDSVGVMEARGFFEGEVVDGDALKSGVVITA